MDTLFTSQHSPNALTKCNGVVCVACIKPFVFKRRRSFSVNRAAAKAPVSEIPVDKKASSESLLREVTSRWQKAAEAPNGWHVYKYVKKGYRFNLGWPGATKSVFWSSHNEFWNVWTDFVPLVFFLSITAFTWSHEVYQNHLDKSQQQALMWTLLGTVFQHVCSLFAHTYECVDVAWNSRVWFLDYYGIAINATWNTLILSLMAHRSQVESWWTELTCLTLALTMFGLYFTFQSLKSSTPARAQYVAVFTELLDMTTVLLTPLWEPVKATGPTM
ncbi:hypothetical protein CYMTET_5634 [Cymbomonas tetramitiformis]|uniref:Uncharacterized protein n=1 Tax=Cymbomonas tetramitiformis TaxID=36881 RepID=A0AAE0LIN6_9CHLO|nr:hypothetical protein CYMTET_5634 [Cymbomonas tetramitiformis]